MEWNDLLTDGMMDSGVIGEPTFCRELGGAAVGSAVVLTLMAMQRTTRIMLYCWIAMLMFALGPYEYHEPGCMSILLVPVRGAGMFLTVYPRASRGAL